MNFTKFLLVLSSAMALASCGGNGPLTSAGGTVNSAQAIVAVGQINTALGAFKMDATPTAPTIGGGGPTPTPGLMAGVYDACTTITPASGVDADGDGMDLLRQYNYNCNGVMSGSTPVTLLGTVTFRDLDDTKKWLEGGYSYNYDVTSQGNGSQYRWDWTDKGDTVMTAAGSGYQYTSEYRSSGEGMEHGVPYSATWQGTWKFKIVPDTGTTNKWDTGKIEFSGYFGMKGNFGPSGTDVFNVVFELESKNIIYDYAGGCSTYKSGTITYRDGSGNETILTFNCMTTTATFNGDPIAIATPVQAAKDAHRLVKH